MRRLIIMLCVLASPSIFAQQTLWTELESTYQFRMSNSDHLHNARKMHLDVDAMKNTLNAAARGTKKTISLPTRNGDLLNFYIEPTSVMAPTLAARYPEIKTWKITNVTNPEIIGRIDMGPLGFHGVFHTRDGDRIFIDPEYQAGSSLPSVYNVLSHRASQHAHSEFTCQLHGESEHNALAARVMENLTNDMRTYRLALSTTGEYTALFGGTKELALAGVVKTVNRLNQVFERDLNVRLELIADNDKLLFTSPDNDPYDNQDAPSMAQDNITSTDNLIGADNYDIGHVFGTGRTGGLAYLNSACGVNKAGGVTGSNSPTGDAFNIDYVAHEFGHQLGASHTFNGYQQNCNVNNRAQNSAVEPGSGSSIMSYAGICGGDNLQSNSNAFFHSVSIAQIKNFTNSASGARCGTLTATLNNKPEIEKGQNYTIPARTPFVLNGSTSDMDGDILVHSWEQMDTGPSTGIYTDLMDNPLFRIWNPTTTTTRYFPKLQDLLNNKTARGEMLPTTNRELNFSFLVRDNHGGVTTDNVKLDVIDTGTAFAITSQSIPAKLQTGQSFELNWNVADTDRAPISCQSVNIGFIDRDANYLPVLSETPNDGQQTISLTQGLGSISEANLKVSCSDNIFFAVSRSQHTVDGTMAAPFSSALLTEDTQQSSPLVQSNGASAYPEPETATQTSGGGFLDFKTNLTILLLLLARLSSMHYAASQRKPI